MDDLNKTRGPLDAFLTVLMFLVAIAAIAIIVYSVATTDNTMPSQTCMLQNANSTPVFVCQ